MSAITTIAQLEALPVGAQLTDNDGDTWLKGRGRTWLLAGGSGVPSERLFTLWAPLAVAGQPELHMVHCCTHGCPNTAALQPGSSYLCPDHGDGGCSNTITKGNDHADH